MFAALYRFELRYHLRQPLFYILFTLFFLLTFGAIASEGVTIGGAIGNVNRNAPYVIMRFLAIMSVFGVLTTTAYVANSVHRDIELKTDALFFSSPIRKATYLLGRFFGSLTIASAVYLGVAFAIMVGNAMPWIDKDRVGPFHFAPYLFSLFVLVVPNLFLFGAIFFCVAALTRSLMATYASVVGFFVAYFVVSAIAGDVENERLASLFDPFGIAAFELTTRYWTVFEKNTRLLPIADMFLWNRLLWTGLAAVILAITLVAFKTTTPARAKKRKDAVEADASRELASAALPRVTQQFGGAASFKLYLRSARVETLTVIKSIPYLIILLLGVANVLGAAAEGGDALYGTDPYPVTYLMLDAILGGFAVFAMLIAAFYAGDIVWRERTLKMNEVHDATPAPTWTIWASKLTALIVSVLLTLVAACAMTIAYQTYRRFPHYQPLLYMKGLLLIAAMVLLVALLAFIAQALTNNKFVGFAIVMLHFVMLRVLPAVHLEHTLYRPFRVPIGTYSDMNGFGPFLQPAIWVTLYWLLFSGILIIVSHLLWPRGTESSFAMRRRGARARFTRPMATALTLLIIGFVSTGCYIYYNTNVLNHYTTADREEQRSAEYEKKYKKYERMPQPRITDVQADVDIDPQHRSVDIRGTYKLVNKTAAPIRELHVQTNPQLTSMTVTIPNARIEASDNPLGHTIYRLNEPLAPGAAFLMPFVTKVRNPGFPNSGINTSVVENGTFFNNAAYFPHIGYSSGEELPDRGKRKKYGLAPIQRMAPPTDMRARMDNGITRDADWINLDTTVSTSPDQIALAPGYLQKEWTANGRRYFHYKTTSPILAFWAYLSARYEVKRGQWHGIPIEIYYAARHPYNVDRMIYAVQKSLDYYTANFSPYQHTQVRILEFPRYNRFAQSFPNTVPYAESIGFIADLRDPENIDYVFYVTAHEIAHQWWAHQVIGGDVSGSTMLVETMAQYSALMVMEKEYGRDKMRRFLKYELDRYLQGRGGELVAEMPLEQVENQQYIHYRKGSLVMYALRDYIGEDRVNAANRAFIAKYRFTQPPYPAAVDLVNEFRKVTPPQQQSLITDLFERITLFDNKTTDAKSTPLAGGKYRVTFTVESKKLQADAKGDEKAVPIDEWIDIGVLGDSGKSKKTHDDKVLLLEKRHITQEKSTFDVIVTGKPTKAGIDPFNKLIDRNPTDNTKKP
jgi:ABC-2 type transport system permease protein